MRIPSRPWPAACMVSLAALGIVFLIMQAVWASAAMATPSKGGFHMVSDFQAANEQVEKVPGVISSKEASMTKLSEARFYSSLDLLQVYWECLLAPDGQEISRSPRQVNSTRLRVSSKEFLWRPFTSKPRFHACWRG